MSKIILSVIDWNSPLYCRGLELRNVDLRRDEGLEDLLSSPEAEASCIHIAALCEGEVVGVMYLLPVDSQEVRAKQVVVSERYRGYGIGAMMMDFAEEVARKQGYRVLTLNGKIEAWGFYDRLGYKASGAAYEWMATTVKPYMKALQVCHQVANAAR